MAFGATVLHSTLQGIQRNRFCCDQYNLTLWSRLLTPLVLSANTVVSAPKIRCSNLHDYEKRTETHVYQFVVMLNVDLFRIQHSAFEF